MTPAPREWTLSNVGGNRKYAVGPHIDPSEAIRVREVVSASTPTPEPRWRCPRCGMTSTVRAEVEVCWLDEQGNRGDEPHPVVPDRVGDDTPTDDEQRDTIHLPQTTSASALQRIAHGPDGVSAGWATGALTLDPEPRRFCSRCDGYGVINDDGYVAKCPECDGHRLSNEDVKRLREVPVPPTPEAERSETMSVTPTPAATFTEHCPVCLSTDRETRRLRAELAAASDRERVAVQRVIDWLASTGNEWRGSGSLFASLIEREFLSDPAHKETTDG